MIPNRITFCNIIMIGEPTHTESKEVIVPALMFLSERMPQDVNCQVTVVAHFNMLAVVTSLS